LVRAIQGLPPATDEELANGIEAATDDLVKAVYFVRSRWRAYNVDISRIAIGGFSAGAIISLNAAFIERVPVKAVISISGRISDLARGECMTGAADEPAVLMFVGERDLPVILDGSGETEAHMKRVGLRHQVVRLLGATHFYSKMTPVPTSKNGEDRDVESTIAEFLYNAMKLKRYGSFFAKNSVDSYGDIEAFP
jgi:alpha/beta superfamily hydrolase